MSRLFGSVPLPDRVRKSFTGSVEGYDALSEGYTVFADALGAEVKVLFDTERPVSGSAELVNGTIRIDSDVLGVDPTELDMSNSGHQGAFIEAHGLILHELAHALHSRWSVPEGTDPVRMAVASSLEDLRAEYRFCVDRPQSKQWIRTALSHRVGHLAKSAPTPESATVLLLVETVGRSLIGLIPGSDIGDMLEMLEDYLSEDSFAIVHETVMSLKVINDFDSRAMMLLVEDLMAIIDPSSISPEKEDEGPVGERQKADSDSSETKDSESKQSDKSKDENPKQDKSEDDKKSDEESKDSDSGDKSEDGESGEGEPGEGESGEGESEDGESGEGESGEGEPGEGESGEGEPGEGESGEPGEGESGEGESGEGESGEGESGESGESGEGESGESGEGSESSSGTPESGKPSSSKGEATGEGDGSQEVSDEVSDGSGSAEGEGLSDKESTEGESTAQTDEESDSSGSGAGESEEKAVEGLSKIDALKAVKKIADAARAASQELRERESSRIGRLLDEIITSDLSDEAFSDPSAKVKRRGADLNPEGNAGALTAPGSNIENANGEGGMVSVERDFSQEPVDYDCNYSAGGDSGANAQQRLCPICKGNFDRRKNQNKGTKILVKKRNPLPEETRLRRSLGERLKKAQFLDRTSVKLAQQSPPGRLNTREGVRAESQKAQGRMVTARPWKAKKHKVIETNNIRVAVLGDASGSIKELVTAFSISSWAITSAVRDIGGKSINIAFGDVVGRVEKLNPIASRQVPVYSANGGTEVIGDAITEAALDLDLLNRKGSMGPRLLVIFTDGDWVDGPQAEKADMMLQALLHSGVKIILVRAGLPDSEKPVEHPCSEVFELTSISEFNKEIGSILVNALRRSR